MAAEVFAWRPSRQQQALLAVLVGAAALALLNCELPAMVAFPVAMAVLVHGGRLLLREARRPVLQVELQEEGARVDGREVAELSVTWRGSLAFLRWRDAAGQVHRRVLWPDTLPADERRRLRLATGHETISPVLASVAP